MHGSSFEEKWYMPGSGEAPWRHGAFPGRPFFIYFLLCKDNNVVIRNLAKTVRVGDNNAANQEYGGSTSVNKCLTIIFFLISLLDSSGFRQ